MKKICLVIAMLSTIGSANANPYNYEVTRVIDGDTVEFKVDWLPPELGDRLKLRIYGVDTPEKAGRAQCAKENKLGLAATKFVVGEVGKAKTKTIIIRDWDKYGGRVLGDLILDDVSLRDTLIAKGYARPYEGDAKKSWCK